MRGAHGSSSSGRNVTLAVICRMMAWISFMISLLSFCGGLSSQGQAPCQSTVAWPPSPAKKRRKSTGSGLCGTSPHAHISPRLLLDVERPALQSLPRLHRGYHQNQLLQHPGIQEPWG